MEEGGVTRAFLSLNPAFCDQVAQGLTHVVRLHAAFSREGVDRWEGVVVPAGVMPKPCVDEGNTLSISTGNQQLNWDLNESSTLQLVASHDRPPAAADCCWSLMLLLTSEAEITACWSG